MSEPPPSRRRPRDLGVDVGELPTGPLNAITDVPGVLVGQVTCWSDDPVARTGVTAILPTSLDDVFHRPPAAGVAVLNGVGELTGSHSIRELGFLDTPILLTGTTSVGRAYDAVVDAMLDAVPAVGEDDVAAPVVGECNDSWLDDSRARNVTVGDARAAIAGAVDGPVAEGVIGAGTGMVAFEWKAGIGTASRVVDVAAPGGGAGTVGVLVLANFGGRRQLRVGGRPVGRTLATEWDAGRRCGDGDGGGGDDQVHGSDRDRGDRGSCIGVVVTDLALDGRQLQRVARRVGLGLARVGSIAGNGSGDIFCAVSTGNRMPRFGAGVAPPLLVADDDLDEVFAAVVEATEECVLNAVFVADTVVGRQGHTVPGLPVRRVLDLL